MPKACGVLRALTNCGRYFKNQPTMKKHLCSLLIVMLSGFVLCAQAPFDSTLVKRLGAIQKLPSRSVKGQVCGDAIFWEVVAQGRAAVPALIGMVTDSSYTAVKDSITGQVYRKGDVAFLVLAEILEMPLAEITHRKWDDYAWSYDFVRPRGLFKHIHTHRAEVQQALDAWWNANANRFVDVSYAIDDPNPCHRQFGVTYKVVLRH